MLRLREGRTRLPHAWMVGSPSTVVWCCWLLQPSIRSTGVHCSCSLDSGHR